MGSEKIREAKTKKLKYIKTIEELPISETDRGLSLCTINKKHYSPTIPEPEGEGWELINTTTDGTTIYLIYIWAKNDEKI